MRLAEQQSLEQAPTGTLILAEEQTQGRGSVVGRNWSSKPKGNLYFTLMFQILPEEQPLKLNLATCVAIAQACRQQGSNAFIKWPNDIWIDMKKVCGMLITSNTITNIGLQANVGIGINVNENFLECEDKQLSEYATSLYNVLGHLVEREKLLADICNNLESLLNESLNQVVDKYKEFDMLCGKQVIVMPKKLENPERYVATAIGFNQFGMLRVRLQDGTETLLTAEEVSLRPQK
eukprot:TRINITY_DN1320_c1_g3_i2.p2 TRINITY_DN1320_c1_g3~~TRINITY_DN1320_c1_g3_i2.p2  ORF type:complete len:235 (-),score=121.94 TRINITY_DN1320_c1_g3_i2:1221-1925(-)